MKKNYLKSIIKQFEYYKWLGEKTFSQINDDGLFWQYTDDSNSIAIIVNHLWGNMLSRWTDFLTSDGEKEWRKRDLEFEDVIKTKAELINKWEEGWVCVFNALNNLDENDFDKLAYIRNQGHTLVEAMNRQLGHYAYHVGQIVFIGKMVTGNNWSSLSISKGGSKEFNQNKFSEEKKRGHYTDDFLNK